MIQYEMMKNKSEILYIPNLISLSRFVLLIIAVYILQSDFTYHYFYAAAVVILIWISDLLDGFFARKLNQITELGKIIDPLADKVTVITIGLILLLYNIIPIWFALVIVLRDIIILAAGLYLKSKNKIVLPSNWTGKVSVFIIGCTLLFCIIYAGLKIDMNIYHIENLELYLHFMFLLSIVMSMVSLIVYFYRFKEISFKK